MAPPSPQFSLLRAPNPKRLAALRLAQVNAARRDLTRFERLQGIRVSPDTYLRGLDHLTRRSRIRRLALLSLYRSYGWDVAVLRRRLEARKNGPHRGRASWSLAARFRIGREDERQPKRHRPFCGARCRDGRPCRARAVWLVGESKPRNGRCRMHGGLSTGPRTPEGRAAIAESNRRRAAGSPAKRPSHSRPYDKTRDR